MLKCDSVVVIDWLFQETLNIKSRHDNISIIDNILTALALFIKNCDCVYENTDDGRVTNQIQNIDYKYEDGLVLSSRQDIDQGKCKHWVVPASEILEPKLLTQLCI